jgi:ABC-2 type transport system ATP-binding protein
MTTNIATVVDVSKRFKIFKEKTVKERLLNFRGSQEHKQDFWALRNIDLEIPLGSTMGLVGHNGSGKSTLLKIIGGIYQPTTGSVYRRGRLAALLELGAGFHPDLTGRENVFLSSALVGMNQKETQRHLDAIIDFSGIEQFIDTPVKFYSSGMYVRLAFAASIFSDPDLLIVDEVLAVGDEPFQEKCLAKIREFQREGRSIVLVSHGASTISEFCDQVAVLDHGNLLHVGDTKSGLDILGGIYAEISAHNFLPPGDAHIHELTMHPSKVNANGELILGASIELNVELEVRDIVSPASLQLSLTSSVGQLAYQVDTKDLALELPVGNGPFTFTLSLPDQHLGGGEYTVGLELFDGNQATVAKLDRAGSFFVELAPFGIGTARFNATGSISQL